MSKKPNGYWKDPDNVIAEARSAMQKEGWDTLPCASTLKKHGYNSLSNSARYHGGFSGLHELVGNESSRHPMGYWKNPLNIVAEARNAMEEQGWEVLPNKTILGGNGYSCITTAAHRYHGGMAGLRGLLGQGLLVHPKGFWHDPLNVVAEARAAMEKEGWDYLPSQNVLTKSGYSSLVRAARYHSGMSGLRKLLGQEVLERPKSYWKDPLNVVAEAKKVMEKEGWENLPSVNSLRKHGYHFFGNAAKFHGGISGLRSLLGEDCLIRPMGFWQDPANVVAEAKKAMKGHNWSTLPSAQTLREHGYHFFGNAAIYHGGFSALRALISKSLDQPTEQEQLEVLVGGYDA